MPGQPGQRPPATAQAAQPLPRPLAAAQATQPLISAAEAAKEQGLSVSYVLRSLVLCTLYITISAALIQFNKYLMHEDRFPFAMALSAGHMTMTLVMCNLLYFIKPSLFTAMSSTVGQRATLLRWFVPLGCLFAVGLACSNRAYHYCNVSFLQFMKEANVAVVFGLGVLAGVQDPTRTRLVVLAWILVGALMAVRGEVHFVLVGFLIQSCSQFGECGKTVLGEWIMRRSSLKLDPMTFTMFMSPVCLSILASLTLLTWEHEIAVRFMSHWHLLLPNACLAFTLNIMVAVVIKECSALSFMLVGLVKDMIIVLASVFFFGEVVVRQQLLGFVVCLGGICFWSYMRIDPNAPMVRSIQYILGDVQEKSEKSELNQLLARKV